MVVALNLIALAVAAMWFVVPAVVLAMALTQIGFVAYMVAAIGRPAVARG